MKVIRDDGQELPQNVRDALKNFVQTEDYSLSKNEIENAWKTFSNTLAFVESANKTPKVKTLSSFFRFRRVLPTLSGMSAAAFLVYYLAPNFENGLNSQVFHQADAVQISSLNLNSQNREYKLPKPEKFSELVSFVKDERRVALEDSEPVTGQRIVRDAPQDSYERRLSAELEQSLRNSFRSDSDRWSDIEPMGTTLSSNLMRADVVDSQNLIYVSR